MILLLTQITISNAEEYGNSPPSPPNNLHVNDRTSQKVTIAWDKSSDTQSYHIFRSSTATGTFTQVGTVNQPIDNTTVLFTETGLKPLTSYWYKVMALNNFGESTSSEVINVLTKDLSQANKISSPKNGELLNMQDIQVKCTNLIGVTESTICVTDINTTISKSQMVIR